MSHIAAASPPQLREHVAPKGQRADKPGCSAARLLPRTCLQLPKRLQQQVPKGCHCSNAHVGGDCAAGGRFGHHASVQLLADEGALQERPQPVERLCSVRCGGLSESAAALRLLHTSKAGLTAQQKQPFHDRQSAQAPGDGNCHPWRFAVF